MKKIGLPLLAVVMMVGMAGCGGGDDFSPTLSNMAGVYNLTKVTSSYGSSTVTVVPPDISGTINLTTVGTYAMDITLLGERFTESGTYFISEDTIIFNGLASGPITDDGRKFSFTIADEGLTAIFEFNRS